MTQKNIPPEVIELKFDEAERMQIKHGFLRSFAQIPSDYKEMEVFAEVIGIKFREEFPSMANILKTLKNNIKPVIIEGFSLGYVESIKKGGYEYIKESKSIWKFRQKTGEKYSLAKHHILALAIINSMGFSSSGIDINCHINHKEGQNDWLHSHGMWAMAIALRGIEGVKTHFYYEDDIFFSAALKRGDILLIPPNIFHAVDGYDPQKITFSNPETGITREIGKSNRNTAAYFFSENKKDIAPEKLAEAVKKYVLPKGAAPAI